MKAPWAMARKSPQSGAGMSLKMKVFRTVGKSPLGSNVFLKVKAFWTVGESGGQVVSLKKKGNVFLRMKAL
jgi:hypothetical protein